MRFEAFIKKVRFGRDGLIPVIIQDLSSGQVLMCAYMNRQALRETIKSGQTHFWSRARKRLWLKGETSGYIQKVRQVYLDCDSDSLLIKVSQVVAACHSGHYTCFYRKLNSQTGRLQVVSKKIFNPQKVYHK